MNELLAEDGRGTRRWLAGIIGLAVGLRIALAMAHMFWFPDSVDYDALARAIVAHRPYEVSGMFASRMPGYPIFLAGIFAVCGHSLKAVGVVQGFLGGAIVGVTYLIGRRAGERVGLLAAGLAAVDPLSVGFSAAVLSETPFTLMLMAGLWVCICGLGGERDGAGSRHGSEYRPVAPGWEAPGWGVWWWGMLGVVWAAGVYLRAEALLCLPALGAVVIWFTRGWRCKWRACGGAILAMAIVVAALLPWLVRNHRLIADSYLTITTLEGTSLYEAVYPGADGGPKQDVIVLPAEMRGMNEVQRNAEWGRRGWHYVFADPGRMARLAVRKVARTWTPFMNAGGFQGPVVQSIMGGWQVPLFILAVLGLLTPMMEGRTKAVLLVPVVYFTAVHALFLGSVRYRVAVMPVVCIFAAAGVMFAWQRWIRTREAGAKAKERM